MTNEELTVLAGLATELYEKREDFQDVQEQRDRFVNRTNCLEREKSDLVAEIKRLKESEFAELNRLRESEANALNAAEEAKRERDEARKKLCEWMRFMNDTIYTELVKATERKDCRKIVKDAVSAMSKFSVKYTVKTLEGGMAK